MATETGTALAQGIRAKIADMRAACAGLGEDAASQAPTGRWTPKEILSHLIGPEKNALLHLLQRFTASDAPRIELVPEQTYFSGERKDMRLGQLLDMLEQEYESVAAFAEGLNEAELARTAHIPLFKDSPLTDRPTLAAFLGGLGQYHVQMHIEHLREILAQQPK